MAANYYDNPPWIPVTESTTLAGLAKVYYNPETKTFLERASFAGGVSSKEYEQGTARYSELWKEHQKKINNYINIQNGGVDDASKLFEPGGAKTLATDAEAKGKTLRYPKEDENYFSSSTTDYIIFEYGEYIPPFGKDLGTVEDAPASGIGPTLTTSITDPYDLYQLSSDMEAQEISVKSPDSSTLSSWKRVILPIPQDLSTEIKQNWEAKSFSSIGVAAIKAAEGDFSKIPQTLDNSDVLTAAAAAIKTSVLNSIPGVGGNIGLNDLLGSTRGLILNPNAEMLYDSPDLREIAMSFKMIARSADEAKEIKMICDWFRKGALPRWGAGEAVDPKELIGKDADELVSGDNFLRVPYLCKFQFMKGSGNHPYLNQYKPCAVTGIEVNYTPDGTYATYTNGAPVATELRIRFAETKLIFNQEMVSGGF